MIKVNGYPDLEQILYLAMKIGWDFKS